MPEIPTFEEFYKQRERERKAAATKAWRERNPEKVSEFRKIYYEQNKEHIKNKLNERRSKNREKFRAEGRKYYDVNRDRRAAYHASYRNGYDINSGPIPPRPKNCEACGRKTKKLHFDHCHLFGHFRGWICRGCNLALGHVDDNPRILKALLLYLERTDRIL